MNSAMIEETNESDDQIDMESSMVGNKAPDDPPMQYVPSRKEVETPIKETTESDSEREDFTCDSLSPVSKAKSLSSPDLIRREAEDWDLETDDDLVVTSHGSVLSSSDQCPQNQFIQHPESFGVRNRGVSMSST